MASTSSSPPVTLSSTLSLPRSCTSHTTNKIENLVEYSYIPESAQISESSYPLISPYQLYKRPSSFTRSIRTLISTRRPHPKEYIQSSRLDQCALQATSVEQYVTLEIPSELLSNWKREARLAMLDTRFKQYQDAVIGTVLTTLHAGSVLLTFYPNFNLSLQDPNLPITLKVQVQIQAESDQIPTIIQIPRQIPRHELIKLMPLEWISNYEQFHNNTAPIQTSESMFERRQDGTVRMTFKPPLSAPQEPPRLSFTYTSMITAVQTAQEDLLITGFNSEGYLVYPAKQNGHFLWDAPGSGMCDPTCPCWDDWDEDDDYATTRKKKPKKKKSPVSCHHCDPKPPQDPPPPPAPLPFYRKELKWIAKHCKSETPSPIPLPTPPLTCMMFSSTSSDYSSSFPPLDTHTDSQRNVVSKPFVPSLITSSDHLEPPKPFESVLNWQTQNARAQNDTLFNINSKVENISLRTEQLETKRYYGPEFNQKEREIRRLKAELAQIESEKQRPTLFTTSSPIPSIGPPYHPFAFMLSPIRQYDPSKLFCMTHTLFRDNPLPPPPKPKPKHKPQPRPVTFHPPSITIPGQHSPVDHSPTTDDQTSDSNLAVSDSHTETDTESSVSTSDSEKSYADITRILMAQPDQPTPGQTSHTEPYFDISSEVEEEMPESSTTNQPPPAQAQTSATTQSVLREFVTRFTGALRDWFDSLGRYRQLQFVDLPEVSSALAVLHDQFLGDPSAVFEAARRDYLNMKCCSLNAKDLDFHYKRMSLLFNKLNGFNEPTLTHVFLASLPDELQPDIQQQLTASNLSLDNISLGKIFQLAKTCLDKLCEQKQFFKELLKYKEPFGVLAKKPYLQIKCKKKKDCDCSPKKKRHFKKFRNPEFSSRPRRSRKPYRFFQKKSSSSRDIKRRKSSRLSSAKRKAIMPKTVPAIEKNLFVFALQNSSDDLDSDQSQVIFHQQLLSLDTTVPIPSIKLQILPSKFQRLVPAIGLIDTGAQRSMLNPHILAPEYWTEYEEHFKAVNGSHDEHRQLLTQFDDIVQSHGIMLSAKKSTIATDNIEFLDFIPHVDHYTRHLSTLLKKKPPEWNANHTNAVTTLKKIAQNPPPLKLITDGKRILQTDASDDSWGAILLEEINGKEHFIAYASGQFSDTQKHYHSVFKEILAVKNYIKKIEYHLIGHHFIIRMDSSAFPNILNFKGKTVPEKMLLRLKDWFSKYDFLVKHIKGSQNLIPDMLSRLSKPEKPLTLFSTTYHFPIISMATSLPPEALTKKTFPFNKTFSSTIQEFARKALFRFFMKAYLVTEPFPFSSFHPENLFLTGLTLDPSRETTEDVLWYIWCLTILYATKPYFQHPDTNLFWTQDQVYEWFIAPHPAVIDNEIQDVLHNYLCQLNHQPPPLKDIFHTSLDPQHDLLMIPTSSAISNPKSTSIIIKEERPDYIDFLYQDSQDPWEDFLPLSQHLQQFPQPSMNEPGSSSQPPKADTTTKPSKVDKATQTSPRPGYRRDCPYPPCRGPHCKHPKLSNTFFPKSNRGTDSDETDSSSEDDYMNLRSP
ncbi:hypothetical protein KPL71_001180 [Citrus sinensis]|uniref:Uncharacterized protein n=1 Tax=Citrus sinensis TaxID=2711 RepID=A0ACB8NUZ7_CITSI|nr:hypothetical protein KPL71_001180 [Citrus sinensis]